MLSRVKKRHIVLLSLAIAALTVYVFWYRGDYSLLVQKPIVRAYDEEKDFAPLVLLMNKNMFMISERPDFSPVKVLKNRAPFDDMSRKGQVHIDVGESFDKETAGFVAYFKNSAEEGYIWLLAVDEKFRGKGIGEALMHSAITNLKSQGVNYISISTRSINKPALSLYKKLGFLKQSENKRGIVKLILRNL